MTLSLGLQPVDLGYADVKEIRDRLVEPSLSVQGLRHVLSNALDAGHGRIDESHRLELVTTLQAIESEAPHFFSPALGRLYEAAQDPIIPTG